MESQRNGQLQGAPGRRARGRPAAQCHRQGAQGRAPGPGRRERRPMTADETTEPGGLAALRGRGGGGMGVWVAAPSAGALLADWGADVIKVEPPNGDPMRSAFGSLGIGQDVPNPAFAQDNRGKRRVVLDLRDEQARQSLEELLSTADVFLTNLRPD